MGGGSMGSCRVKRGAGDFSSKSCASESQGHSREAAGRTAKEGHNGVICPGVLAFFPTLCSATAQASLRVSK